MNSNNDYISAKPLPSTVTSTDTKTTQGKTMTIKRLGNNTERET